MGASLNCPQDPCAVELIGPPGVGKSTVAAAIADARPDIEVVGSLRPDRFRTAFTGAWRAGGSLTSLRRAAPRPKVARLLVRAETAATVVAANRRRAPLVVFDQGPVYTLARLDVAGVDWSGRVGRWRAGLLDGIADSLDATVWLTCPAEVALARIKERAKSHAAREQGLELVGSYQRAYDWLRSELASRGLAEVEVDTDRRSIDEAVESVVSALSHGGPEPLEGR